MSLPVLRRFFLSVVCTPISAKCHCSVTQLIFLTLCLTYKISAPGHSISYKIVCAPSERSNQPAHPRSLIGVFAGHSVGSQGTKACLDGRLRLISLCGCAG